MTAPLSDVRERLSEIIDDVATAGSEFVITKHGRNTAVLIGYDEYEALIETLNILSDVGTMAALAEAEADLAAGDFAPLS
jgi:prevent-host-death family protein